MDRDIDIDPLEGSVIYTIGVLENCGIYAISYYTINTILHHAILSILNYIMLYCIGAFLDPPNKPGHGAKCSSET